MVQIDDTIASVVFGMLGTLWTILCVGMVGFVYMLCIILYILAIEYRSETIGLALSSGYNRTRYRLTLGYPW